MELIDVTKQTVAFDGTFSRIAIRFLSDGKMVRAVTSDPGEGGSPSALGVGLRLQVPTPPHLPNAAKSIVL